MDDPDTCAEGRERARDVCCGHQEKNEDDQGDQLPSSNVGSVYRAIFGDPCQNRHFMMIREEISSGRANFVSMSREIYD